MIRLGSWPQDATYGARLFGVATAWVAMCDGEQGSPAA